ncbi:MAG: helix-turn-helix transcriptional regulator [Clostridia bacterium]|nr:helix-turn-helix transcriptional regulator [Clostridia bacterium]
MKSSELLTKYFTQALKSKRAELKYTQEKMAEKSGISWRQYQNLEKGENLPKLQTFFNIAVGANIDLNKFVELLIEKGYTVTDENN